MMSSLELAEKAANGDNIDVAMNVSADDDSSDDDDDVNASSMMSFLLGADLRGHGDIKGEGAPLSKRQMKKRSRAEKLKAGIVAKNEHTVEQYERHVRQKTGPGWDEREAVARLPTKGENGNVVFDAAKTVRRKSPAAIEEAMKEKGEIADEEKARQEKKAEDISNDRKLSKSERVRERILEEKKKAVSTLRRLSLAGKMDEMATAAQAVIADPDLHLAGISGNGNSFGLGHSGGRNKPADGANKRDASSRKKDFTKLGKWETLMLLASDSSAQVQQFAILSIVAVFKDILPDYRIRLPTSKEREVRVTKEVRLARKRDRALLTSYQSYLKLLERNASDASTPLRVRVASVKAMCTMFLEKPGFNFGANILSVVVPNMNSDEEKISEICTACVATMFKTDAAGESSLATVRSISKMIQNHRNGMDGKVRPGTIRTLLALPLSADLKNAARAMAAEKRKRDIKKKKKKAKKRGNADEIAKELAEAATTPDHITKYTRQAETLREVFLLYLRVLKRAPTSPLLPEVLEGISKFIHLVNLDLVRDLVTIMLELCDTKPDRQHRLSPRAVMQCILTVGIALKGAGKELKVDEGAFLSSLGVNMARVAQMVKPRAIASAADIYAPPTADSDEMRKGGHPDIVAPLILRCINTLFVVQRPRVAVGTIVPVVKNALRIAASTSVHFSLALLSIARTLVAAYPLCKSALGISTPSKKAEAAAETFDHLGFADDAAARQSAPGAATSEDDFVAWELGPLRSHFHPKIRQSANAFARDVPLPPNERAPLMLSEYNPFAGGFSFNPAVRDPPKRTAAALSSKNKSKKRKRSQRQRAKPWLFGGSETLPARSPDGTKTEIEDAFARSFDVAHSIR